MSFWDQQMPRGMKLRSAWEASHIADPDRAFTLDAFARTGEAALDAPLPLEGFVAYGRWFARQVAPDVDPRRITALTPREGGFALTLADGEPLFARRVIVATGIAPFAYKPPVFRTAPAELVSHSGDHRDFERFAGQRVLVVGSGQASLESAALLREAGAEPAIVTRAAAVHWLRGGRLRKRLGPLAPLLYPPTDVGPPGLNWLIAMPDLFRRLPTGIQVRIYRRAVRPAGAAWLLPRLEGVPIALGRHIAHVAWEGTAVRVRLDDGTANSYDHVLLGTGYRVNVRRYPFLTPEAVRALDVSHGYPELGPGYETSIPGLHMLGAPAGWSYGPVARFVSGTGYTARSLTRHLLRAERGGVAGRVSTGVALAAAATE